MIENAVLIHLFSSFSDPVGLEKAINDAIPKKGEIRKLINNQKILKNQLTGVKIAKDRLIKMIEDGAISPEDVRSRMQIHNEREHALSLEINSIKANLGNQPSKDQIKKSAGKIRNLLKKKGLDIKCRN
jgi:hypothetical protein